MKYTVEQLEAAMRHAFEDGWNATGQGCNAEHHSLSSEELAHMRNEAIKGRIAELNRSLEPITFAIVRFSEFDRSAPGKIIADEISEKSTAMEAASALNGLRRGRYSVFTSDVLRAHLAEGKVSV